MLTNIQGIIECINDDFTPLTDTNYLQLLQTDCQNIFITNYKKDVVIYHTKYKFIFNHESPGHADLYISEKWCEGINHFTNNNYKNFISRIEPF